MNFVIRRDYTKQQEVKPAKTKETKPASTKATKAKTEKKA